MTKVSQVGRRVICVSVILRLLPYRHMPLCSFCKLDASCDSDTSAAALQHLDADEGAVSIDMLDKYMQAQALVSCRTASSGAFAVY